MRIGGCARRLERLAWAAGFFDGEGSTFAKAESRRPGYRQLNVAVPQSGGTLVPEVLIRFQEAVHGMGHISRPWRSLYQWRALDFVQARAAIKLLWPELGTVKRSQSEAAIRLVDEQYTSGRYRPRPGRRRPPLPLQIFDTLAPAPRDRVRLDRAWAAGFLDAEGSFGLVRAKPRVGGQPWYRIRASADQHGEVGRPAAVLLRLQRVLGAGRIERHGEPDDFKWVVEGLPAVERALVLVRPWLGSVKRDQAQGAMNAFRGQVRLKGDRIRCTRGHLYDRRVITKSGRVRGYCNACARLGARRIRALEGIQPRQFRDPIRRYTE